MPAYSPPLEEATFEAQDGTRLHGWFIDHPNPRGTLLYFHGNAENVSYLGPLLELLNQRYGLQVLAFDYRGYGKSAGSPNEPPGIYLDSQAALGWLNQRTNTQPADIVLFGRSIGGAVAVQLAATRGCKALVLENTFTSMPDAAAVQFPWLPVRWIMRNRYPSIRNIRNCKQPLLQAHGTADTIIPFEIGKRLFDASPSPHKRFLEFPSLGHNDPTPEKFWQAFAELISEDTK